MGLQDINSIMEKTNRSVLLFTRGLTVPTEEENLKHLDESIAETWTVLKA